MPPRTTEQRFERNIEHLRALVNAGSSHVVRDSVVGGAISGGRRKYPLPSIGYRSGKLTVTGYISGARRGVSALIVKCDCGAPEYTVDHHNFKNFRSTRCNVCAKKSSTKTRKLYWGYAAVLPDDEHRERLLNRLSAAISRCHIKTTKAFIYYGGRGVSVYRGWRNNRVEFLEYVQTLDGWDNPALDMDRIDVNGDYAPGNIRFVSRSVNAQNKRKVKILQTELDDLRHRLRRAEEQIHSCDQCRPRYRS